MNSSPGITVSQQLTTVAVTSWILLLDRMAHYSIRGILIIWMINEMNMADADAFALYGTLVVLVHLSALPGGLLSDLLFGPRMSIVIMSGIAGFFILIGGMGDHSIFKITMAVAFFVGGMTKPIHWTLISNAYERDDNSRDAALLVMYIAINIGALIGTTVLLMFSHGQGLRSGFIISGTLMLLASVSAYFSKGLLPNVHASTGRSDSIGQFLAHPVELIRIAQMVLLFGMLVVFWTVFELWYSSVYSWLSDVGTITVLGTIPISMSTFQGVSSAFSILLPLPLLLLYVLVRNKRWSSMRLWAPLTLLCSILLLVAMHQWEGGHTATMLIGTTALLAIAELWINAIGFSMVSRLAPQRFIATSIGAVTLAFWISNALSKVLESSGTMVLLLILCAGALVYALLAHSYRKNAEPQVPQHAGQE